MSKNSSTQNHIQFQEWFQWLKRKYSIVIKPKKPTFLEDYE